ncbi:MAG: pseudouridine synthase, partial [Gammaproteobacteria bacterium]
MDDKSDIRRARTVSVGEEHVDRRLDNYLLAELKGVPRSRIYRMVRSGEVRVNKGRVKAGYRLQVDDQVRIPPVRMGESAARTKQSNPSADLLSRIIYEDEALLVVNKPAGLAVHGGSGIAFGLIEQLRALRDDLRYLELVHRLDRETSGCLVVAKKRSALRNLHEQFREGAVKKIYLALLLGKMKSGAETCRFALQTKH